MRNAFDESVLTFSPCVIRNSCNFSNSSLKRLTINVELDIEQLKTAATIDLCGKGLKVEEAIVVAKCIEMNR